MLHAYNVANQKLDKAVVNNVKHKNYAARQKSRLAQAINTKYVAEKSAIKQINR